MKPKVAILDYGMGNLRSLETALERVGAAPHIIHDRAALAKDDRLVLPGQGAFGTAMAHIDDRQLRDALVARIASPTPLLGICLGMQIFFERSEEAPSAKGLGIIPAPVRALPAGPATKIPHMGWSDVTRPLDHPVWAGLADPTAFYFVHSFAASEAPQWALGHAHHGEAFLGLAARDTTVLCQFHPEKSQSAGRRLLQNWLSL